MAEVQASSYIHYLYFVRISSDDGVIFRDFISNTNYTYTASSPTSYPELNSGGDEEK